MIERNLKNKGSKKEVVVYTTGTWDLFHIGHLNILKRSKALGTKLIVGVSTDELVASYKGKRPYIPYEYRKKIIESCRYVDKVVKQEELLPISQLKSLNFDILTIGDDWKEKHLDGLGWVEKHPHKKVVYLPYTKSISSTEIKKWTKESLLRNKNVLVTGASSGIGRAIAEKCAQEGANVGVHYSRNQKEALELFKRLSTITKTKLYKFDFNKNGFDLVEKFVKDFGKIDVLVNNAGTIDGKSFEDVKLKDYDRTFNVNAKVHFFLAKSAFKQMKNNGGGKIINISSATTKYGSGRNSSIHYAASKAVLETLTLGLAKLGAKHNVLVNSIRPGVIGTRLQINRSDLKERIELIPLKRMGTVNDIASMVIYLASDQGNFITGESITITGGE